MQHMCITSNDVKQMLAGWIWCITGERDRVTITSLSAGCWAASQYIHSTALSYHSRMLGSSQQSALPSAVQGNQITAIRNISLKEPTHGPAFHHKFLGAKHYFSTTQALREIFLFCQIRTKAKSIQDHWTIQVEALSLQTVPVQRRAIQGRWRGGQRRPSWGTSPWLASSAAADPAESWCTWLRACCSINKKNSAIRGK